MRNTDSAGFTIIEALVTLTVISVVAVLISTVFSIGIRSIAKSQTVTRAALIRLKTDSKIRTSIEKIRIPYWETDVEFSVSDAAITAVRYEGKKLPVSIFLPAEISHVHYESVRTKNGIPVGCRVYYTFAEKEYVTAAVFASIPPGTLPL